MRFWYRLAQESTGKQSMLGPRKMYLAVQPAGGGSGGAASAGGPPPLAPAAPQALQAAPPPPVHAHTLAVPALAHQVIYYY